MADLVIAILSPLVEPVRKCIAAPLKRQYNYLFRFNGNMRSLRETATKLRTARRELQEQVSAAQRNGEEIFPEVLEWLKDANDIQEEEERIHNGTPAVQNAGCFTMISSRYSLSKRAVKATVEMEGLLDKGKFNSVAKPVGPSGEAPIPMTGQKHKFLSREQIQDNVVKALKDEKVNLIGVYGMGGVGKTTLAQNIGDTVIEKKIFDERAMTTVSQQVDLKKIQREIAEVLGLEKMKAAETLQERAHILHARLTGTRRTLIILDDIWKALNLEELGIPRESDSGRCTVLLTSRNKDVLNRMDAQVFEVKVLPDEEAWSLFKEKAGTCVDDPALKPLAEEVAKECKGLPIALVTVGSALKGGDKANWEDALQQLKTHIPRNLDLVEEVYTPLRLSYDFLKDQESKTLFLLCCLFPEDFDVNLEDLTFYGMGLGTFEGVNTLHQARNRVSRIVSILKSRSLLLDGRYMHHVRMHDVVRDVAIFIASEEGLFDAYPDRSCEWVSEFLTSSNESVDHLRGSKFSNLHLLIVHRRGTWDPYAVDSSCLVGMKSLNVLCFKNIASKLLPEAIEFSDNLRTLQFLDNHNEECLSNVGKLLNLEILICHGCRGIKELPVEIGNLRHLKLLDMSRCSGIERVAEGSISKLVELEELKLGGSFRGWESRVGVGNEKERRNASLKELQSLTKLRCLEIHISNLDLVEEEIHLPIMSLGKYKIWFGKDYSSLWDGSDKAVGFKGVVDREYNMGRWIHRLAMMAEQLHFDGNIPRNFHPSEAHNTIKILTITNCTTLEKVGVNHAFPVLEYLFLRSLPSLTHLLENANQTASFTNLRRVESSSEDGSRSLKFQYLKELILYSLPSLTTFVEGVASIEFPVLHRLCIYNCPKLESVVVGVDLQNHDDECFHWFCNDQVKFGRLKNLTIGGCDEITKVWCKQIPSCFFSTLDCLDMDGLDNIRGGFSSSIANNLVSLITFNISSCKRIERVITDEMMGESENDRKTKYCITFPKLMALSLVKLETLIDFGDSGIESIVFPSLESLKIEDCPKFKYMISSLESEDGRNHDDNKCFHLFCNKKGKFDGLKVLNIQGFIGNIWCEQFPVGIFKSLTELTIRKYNNIKSLFSTSMVEDLVNLQRLSVDNCEHMEKVAIDGKEINRNSTITFQNLKYLHLENLPLLGCAFDFAIQLPLLEELKIVRCPRMKFITSNFVSTPNLKSMYVDGKKEALDEVKDLNAIFERQHEKESTSREDEDGDDEPQTPSLDGSNAPNSTVSAVKATATTGEEDGDSIESGQHL